MALTHVTAVRNTYATAMQSAIAEGVVFTTARLLFKDSQGTTVATFQVPVPASPGENVENGILTLPDISPDLNAAGGVAVAFELQNRAGNTVLSGTITEMGGGGDIVMYDTTIEPGNTVSVTTLSYEAPQ